MLHTFLTDNADEIIARTRDKLSARMTPMPTEAELDHGVPRFLGQLIDRLGHTEVDAAAIKNGAAEHGGKLLAMGFDVSEVVRAYGDVCQVVTSLAEEMKAPITPDEFRQFNGCLDEAIANAVTEYERARDASAMYDGAERLGVLAHELRNRLSSAMLAVTILQEGKVGMSGSTGAVLVRSLRGMRDLISHSLTAVRLESGLGHHRRVSLAEIVGDVAVEANLEANAGGFRFSASSVRSDVEVDVDPQILSAALANLLQNAFKFSHPKGLVSLRASATPERVLIEIEDECGGLPAGKVEDLFQPFEQRNSNRTGLGLGLSITRKGVEAMGGTLGVRDLPGKGCVFFVDLPRAAAV